MGLKEFVSDDLALKKNADASEYQYQLRGTVKNIISVSSVSERKSKIAFGFFLRHFYKA